ncbi:alpha/beta hydrolase [Chloroflexota bacterium]
MTQKLRVQFSCGELSLEGILDIPGGSGPFPAVIVCHPHPLYGGSMNNNVVGSVSAALTAASFVSFKFNFRGVGRSQGEYAGGIGEQEDVKAAISYLLTVEGVDGGRLGLAGYSAGAAFGLPVGCSDGRIKALAAISPPLAMFDFDFLEDCPKPKLLISGSRDGFTPRTQFLEFCRHLKAEEEHDSIHGADHFWQGYESALAARVTTFFSRVLPALT